MHPALIRQSDYAFRERDKREIWEWGADYVRLFPPLTITGAFSTDRSRHFRKPLEWFKDPAVREMNILAPVRSGKTLIGDVALDYTVVQDPGPFRVVMQDDQVAKEHAETRTIPQLKAIAGVEFLLPIDRHKDRGQSIIFPSGHPLYVQGPAINKLQSKGYRYMWVDEPWLPGVSKHFGEIKGRLGDYEKLGISKLLCTGQGGTSGDPWDQQCKSGEWNEWHIQCQSCGHYMPGEFNEKRADGSRWGIVWDEFKDDKGFWQVNRCLETVRFECAACKAKHLESSALKAAWNDSGKYVVIGDTNPTKKTAHWTFVIDAPWTIAVDVWLQARNCWRARRDITQTVTFIRKRLAKHKDDRGAQGIDLVFKREAYNPLDHLKGEVARVITFDRQQEDLFWVQARAWFVNGPVVQTRRVWFGKLFSFEECAKKADEVGATLKPLIDSGFHAKGDRGVYAACIKYGWIAVKGEGSRDSFPHSIFRNGIKKGTIMRSYAPRSYGDSETPLGACLLFRFSVDAMSNLVQGLIDSENWIEPEFHESDALEVEYQKQMRAEGQVPCVNKYGQTEMKWHTFDKDNHAWDLAKMQALSAVIGKILPDPFSAVEETTKGEAA